MKAIETKGRILPNGSIQIDEPIDMPVGEVRLVILFPDVLRQDFPSKLSIEERRRIMAALAGLGALEYVHFTPTSPFTALHHRRLPVYGQGQRIPGNHKAFRYLATWHFITLKDWFLYL